jgi:hypothetical protein
MRSNMHLHKKKRAIKLRREGKSYGQILRALDISSKGTLSSWFKDLKLSGESERRLAKNKKLASRRGLLKFNEERTRKINQENEQEFTTGLRAIENLSDRELLLVGVALYWGEGAKRYSRRGAETMDFSNSDHKMIRLYLRFIREIFKVPEKKIRAGILVHENIDIDKAKEYWSRATGLPKSRFFITKQVSQASRRRRVRNRLPWGTVRIITHNRKLFHHMLGCIEGVAINTAR